MGQIRSSSSSQISDELFFCSCRYEAWVTLTFAFITLRFGVFLPSRRGIAEDEVTFNWKSES